MLTQTVPVSRTGALILARLLTAPARLSPATLRKNLDPFFRGREGGQWQALFDETVAALERDGLIARRPLALTEAGRAQALDFLGLEALPEKTTWSQIKSQYLVAAALGVPPTDEAGRRGVAKAEGLRVAILRSRHGLPGAAETMTQALDALVRKALDMEPTEKLTLGALKARILGRYLELLGHPDLKQFKAQLPVDAVKAGRNTTEELRAAVLRNWLADEQAADALPTDEALAAVASPESESAPADGAASAGETAARPFDLAVFAERVQAAARAGETGRVGDNKVFISHLWRRLWHAGTFPGMTEAEFKRRLAEANHQGLLHLSRADRIEGMDAGDVRESETPDGDAFYHFIGA